jgi:ribosomal protein S27AE
MEYSEGEISRFKEEFAKKKRLQILLVAPMFLVLIVTVFLPAYGKEMGLTPETIKWGFLYYAILAVGLSFYNWRCPACGKYLGRSFWIKFCPKCGAPLG